MSLGVLVHGIRFHRAQVPSRISMKLIPAKFEGKRVRGEEEDEELEVGLELSYETTNT